MPAQGQSAMVPGTDERHPSPHLSPNPSASGGANGSPARQLTSTVPFPAQNRYSFPSFLLPSPPSSASFPMLTLLPEIPPRRSKKSRKSSISRIPPVLPPLPPVEDRDFNIDFEHISRVARSPPLPSLRQQSLTHILPFKQDALPPDYDTPVQLSSHDGKMTKCRRSPSVLPLTQIVSPSSGAAAAAAATGNPVASVAAISSPLTLGAQPCSHRDYRRNLSSSITMTGSKLMRKLSGRSPRPSSDTGSSQATTVDSKISDTTSSSISSPSPRKWSWWRSAVESSGKDDPFFKAPLSHSNPIHPEPNEVEKVHKARSPPVRKVSRPCITVPGNADTSAATLDPHYSRFRPKFTLETNDSEADLNSQSESTHSHYANYSQSCPPSRTHSVYSPHSLSFSPHGQEHQPPRRRWTFAMAMTDKEVTDEALIEVLAGIRLRRDLSGREDSSDTVWDADLILFGSKEEAQLEYDDAHPSHASADHSHTSSPTSIPLRLQRHNSASIAGSRPSQHWQTAQRILFTCRELVRTERHYLALLQILLSSNTETTPPPLMLKYVEELTRVSESYLGQMERNPSAWGVAAAFLGAEEAIEDALVRWCGSVGMWFKDGGYETELESKLSLRGRKLSRAIKLGGGSTDEMHEYDEATSGPLRKVNSWRRSMSSISDLGSTISTVRRKERNAAPPPPISFNGHERQRQPSHTRKPPVRDLAILPTQRIMRYVLLYRDLLDNTPSTALARPLMKRAADATLSLARKCDRAQNNSAFILGSPAALTSSPSSILGNQTSDPARHLPVS